jgi:hypothetical protein
MPSAGAEPLILSLFEQPKLLFERVERVRVGDDKDGHRCQQNENHEHSRAAMAVSPDYRMELNSGSHHGFGALRATA